MLLDNLRKEVGKVIAASHESGSSHDIKRGDDGMDKGRCFILSASIERIHICHDTAQLLIPDVLGDEGIRRHKEVVGMYTEGIGGRTQVEEVSLIGDGEDGIHVSLQACTLLREISGKRIYETLPALSDTISGMVFGEI